MKDSISVCENHPPIGNIREKSFWEIWKSAEAGTLRKSIAAKDCSCTNEVFLWPSITYQPQQLVRAMVGAKVWQGIKPLAPGEKVRVVLEDGLASTDNAKLVGITSGQKV